MGPIHNFYALSEQPWVVGAGLGSVVGPAAGEGLSRRSGNETTAKRYCTVYARYCKYCCRFSRWFQILVLNIAGDFLGRFSPYIGAVNSSRPFARGLFNFSPGQCMERG